VKVTVITKAGVRVEFEADEPTFRSLWRELVGDAATIEAKGATATASRSATPITPSRQPTPPQPPALLHAVEIEPLRRAIRRVGADSDLHRAAMITAAAAEAKMSGGLSPDDLAEFFNALGFRVPPNLKAPFYNAKARGLVVRNQLGLWEPTTAGMAYYHSSDAKAAQLALSGGEGSEPG
jgi:hypothetical protein